MKKIIVSLVLTTTISLLFVNLLSRICLVPFFYNGVASITISATIVYCSLKKIDVKDHLIAYLISLIFFIVVPLTSSRSLTIFLLENIRNEKVVTEREISAILANYVISDLGANRRVTEQLASRTIKEISSAPQTYQLTFFGETIVRFSNLFKKLYNLN